MFHYYKIDNGDDLNGVLRKTKTREEVLRNLNNYFSLDDIKAGDELLVPDKTFDYYNYYTVNKGDSIYKIAKQLNVNPELLMALNGLDKDDYIYPNQQLITPKKGYSYYITASGDTIDEVIKIFNSNKEKFMNENPTIYLMDGQLLVNKK